MKHNIILLKFCNLWIFESQFLNETFKLISFALIFLNYFFIFKSALENQACKGMHPRPDFLSPSPIFPYPLLKHTQKRDGKPTQYPSLLQADIQHTLKSENGWKHANFDRYSPAWLKKPLYLEIKIIWLYVGLKICFQKYNTYLQNPVAPNL